MVCGGLWCSGGTDSVVGRPGPQPSNTGSRSSSEAECACSALLQAQKTDSSPACPCPHSHRTAAQPEVGNVLPSLLNETLAGVIGWCDSASAHPFSVAIVHHGPVDAVVAEGHIVGRHKVLPEAQTPGISSYEPRDQRQLSKLLSM